MAAVAEPPTLSPAPDAAPEVATRAPRNPLRSPRVRRWGLGVVIALVLLILLGFFALPPLIKSKLETTLSDSLHRRTTIEHVAFNPFTLTATVDGVAIRNRDADTPLMAIGQLVADMSSASLWHRAPVVDSIVVRAPRLELVRNDDGRYNVQDLIDAYFDTPPGPPPAFSLNNIEVVDGAITFDDRTVKRVHKIEGLTVGIPFLSSLPYDTEIKVVPALAARVDGAGFNLAAETTPFATAQTASIDIVLDRLSLPMVLGYVALPQNLRIPAGDLSTHLKLSFIGGDAASRALVLSGDIALDKLLVQRADGGGLVALPDLKLALDKLDVFRHAVDVTRVTLTRPEFDLRRQANGDVEWAALAGAMGAGAAPAATPPWQARIRELAIHEGTARVSDASTAPAFQSVLSGIEIEAKDLSNATGDKGHVEVSFATDLGGTVKGDATVVLAPLAAIGRLATTGVNLRRLFPYYQSAINLEVADGVMDLETAFAVTGAASGPPGIALTGGKGEVRSLRLNFPGEKEPLWNVPKLTATGIGVSLYDHAITIEDMTIRQAAMRIRREKDGGFNVDRIMRTTTGTGRSTPPAAPAAASTPAPAGAAASADATWQLSFHKAAMEGTTVDFRDEMPAKPVALRFTDLDVRVSDYSNGHGKRGTIDLRTKVGKGGHFALKGALGTNPVMLDGRVDASSIALAPLQPYLDGVVNLTVTGGAAAMKGKVVVDASSAGNTRTSYAGDVTITDFAALDVPTSSDLVKWKRLALTGVDVATTPQKLGIGAIDINDFFARVIVYADGTLNLLKLTSPPQEIGATAGGEGAAAPAPVKATTATASVAPNPAPSREAGLPVTIGKITLAGGDVQFSDFFVKPNYSAHLTDLNGSVSAMSKTQAGDVAIAGAVERTAPVDIHGRINPFAAEVDLDLTGKAREIELPPLSPYAAKYAGYAIDKGKLSFDVHYRIENRRLVADNKLVLNQLTFGQRVDSPTATKLPVLLAVALLKDRHGVIDINLPISGSLDDPQFSLGGLIIQVIVNLITKAVTAPFALIGAIFGGGEQLSFVEFAPGRAAITPPAEAKLKNLAKALGDRPGLKLEITGRVDPAADVEGLRQTELERAVKAQKRKALAARQADVPGIDAVVVDAAEYPRYLEAAYADASFDKPRNALGFTKTLPPAEMEALLQQHARTDEEALRLLGNERAQAVEGWLIQQGSVTPDRVFLLAPKPASDAPKDGGKSSRVDFSLR